MRIIKEIDKEKVREILDRIEDKKGIIVELINDEVVIVKDNGRYDLRMADEKIEKDIKFENVKCFDFESEFWYWMRNWYDSGEFDNEEYKDEIIGIDEVVRKIEDNKGKGILISVKGKEIRFIKELLADGYRFYREMTLWMDSGKDNELEGCESVEDVIDKLMNEGKEIYYFENYKDFVKWIVIGWNYLK